MNEDIAVACLIYRLVWTSEEAELRYVDEEILRARLLLPVLHIEEGRIIRSPNDSLFVELVPGVVALAFHREQHVLVAVFDIVVRLLNQNLPCGSRLRTSLRVELIPKRQSTVRLEPNIKEIVDEGVEDGWLDSVYVDIVRDGSGLVTSQGFFNVVVGIIL